MMWQLHFKKLAYDYNDYNKEYRDEIEDRWRKNTLPFQDWFPNGQNRVYLPFVIDKNNQYYDSDVAAVLSDINCVITDYKGGYCQQGKRVFRIGKAIEEARKQALQKLQEKHRAGEIYNLQREIDYTNKLYDEALETFINSPYRSQKNENEFMVVISQDPHDIALMSTGRNWTSCMNLNDGSQSYNVFCEVESGGLVAYLIHKNDPEIRNPIARIHIRRFENRKGENMAVPEKSVYGQNVPGFEELVKNFINEKQKTSTPDFYRRRGGEYSDTFGGSMLIAPQDKQNDALLTWLRGGTEDAVFSTWKVVDNLGENNDREFESEEEAEIYAADKNDDSYYQGDYWREEDEIWSERDEETGDYLYNRYEVKERPHDYRHDMLRQAIQQILESPKGFYPKEIIDEAAEKIKDMYKSDRLWGVLAKTYPEYLDNQKFKEISRSDWYKHIREMEPGQNRDTLIAEEVQQAISWLDKTDFESWVEHDPELKRLVSNLRSSTDIATQVNYRDHISLRWAVIFEDMVLNPLNELFGHHNYRTRVPENIVQKLVNFALNVIPNIGLADQGVTEYKDQTISRIVHLFSMSNTDTPTVQNFYKALLPKWGDRHNRNENYSPFNVETLGSAIANLRENGRDFLPFINRKLEEEEQSKAKKEALLQGPMPESLKDYQKFNWKQNIEEAIKASEKDIERYLYIIDAIERGKPSGKYKFYYSNQNYKYANGIGDKKWSVKFAQEEPDLSWILSGPNETSYVGNEEGEPQKHDISRYKDQYGSHRYVYYISGKAVSGLQVMSDGQQSVVANVFTLPEYRNMGFASKLFMNAKRDFPNLQHSKEPNSAAQGWINSMERDKKHGYTSFARKWQIRYAGKDDELFGNSSEWHPGQLAVLSIFGMQDFNVVRVLGWDEVRNQSTEHEFPDSDTIVSPNPFGSMTYKKNEGSVPVLILDFYGKYYRQTNTPGSVRLVGPQNLYKTLGDLVRKELKTIFPDIIPSMLEAKAIREAVHDYPQLKDWEIPSDFGIEYHPFEVAGYEVLVFRDPRAYTPPGYSQPLAPYYWVVPEMHTRSLYEKKEGMDLSPMQTGRFPDVKSALSSAEKYLDYLFYSQANNRWNMRYANLQLKWDDGMQAEWMSVLDIIDQDDIEDDGWQYNFVTAAFRRKPYAGPPRYFGPARLIRFMGRPAIVGNTMSIRRDLPNLGFRWDGNIKIDATQLSDATDNVINGAMIGTRELTPEEVTSLAQMGVDMSMQTVEFQPWTQSAAVPTIDQATDPTIDQNTQAPVQQGAQDNQANIEMIMKLRDAATNAEKGAVVEEQVQKLIELLSDPNRTGELSKLREQFLKFMSSAHKYSFFNTILIFMQNSSATMVGGAKNFWGEKGRNLKEGAQPIWILAPQIRPKHVSRAEYAQIADALRKKGIPENEIKDEIKKLLSKQGQLTGFKDVPVYDISQTQEIPGWTDENGNPPFDIDQFHMSYRYKMNTPDEYADALFFATTKAAEKMNIKVRSEATGYVGGYSSGGNIVLDDSSMGERRVATMFHEFAHEVLHQGEENRKKIQKEQTPHRHVELEAEATAFLLAQAFDIKGDPDWAAKYISLWDNKPQDVMERQQNIHHAYKIIFDAVRKQLDEIISTSHKQAWSYNYTKTSWRYQFREAKLISILESPQVIVSGLNYFLPQYNWKIGRIGRVNNQFSFMVDEFDFSIYADHPTDKYVVEVRMVTTKNNMDGHFESTQPSNDVAFSARLKDDKEPLSQWMMFPHPQSIIMTIKQFFDMDGNDDQEVDEPTPAPYDPTGVDSPVGSPVLV